MIVVTVHDLETTERQVAGPGWSSTRLIVKSDNVGYSVHDTRVQPGAELELHYKQHFETNYCVAGRGEVVDVATGATYAIAPGSVYTLDKNDRHILRAFDEGLHFVCVFNPPLSGSETHQADGSYAIS